MPSYSPPNGNPPAPAPANGNPPDPANGTNPLAFLGPMMGMIASILQNQQDSRSYSDAAYEATRRAEAGLFPLRKDPQKTANIDARRRAMRVNQGPSRRQVDRSRANLEAYVDRKRQERAAILQDRADATAELEEISKWIDGWASQVLNAGPNRALLDYMDEMARNERESLAYQEEQKEIRKKAQYQKVIDDALAEIGDVEPNVPEMDIAQAEMEAAGNAEGVSDIPGYDVYAMGEAIARRRRARQQGTYDPDLEAIRYAGDEAEIQAARDLDMRNRPFDVEDDGGFAWDPRVAWNRMNSAPPAGTAYGAPGMIPTDIVQVGGEAFGYDMSGIPSHVNMPIGMQPIRPYYGNAASRAASSPPPPPPPPPPGSIVPVRPTGPLPAPPGYVVRVNAGALPPAAANPLASNPLFATPFRPNFLQGGY